MLKIQILILVLAIAAIKAEYYYWKYAAGDKFPENVYIFNKTNEAIATIQVKNELSVGKLQEGSSTIRTSRVTIPKGDGLQILCLKPEGKLVWLPTTTYTFKNDIIGTRPVIGGYTRNTPLPIGRAWDNNNKEYSIGNVHDSKLQTDKGFETTFDVLLEECY